MAAQAPTSACGSPDFASQPCLQRRHQVVGYWGGLPPSINPCEAAKRKLASARDLVATKEACGETREWHTTESVATLRSHEQDVNLLCSSDSSLNGSSLRKLNAGDAGTKDGCPTTIRVGDKSVSVLDPIQANGSAAVALGQAREQLRYITDQGSCDNFANAQACRIEEQVWRDTVSALECHARAEKSATSQPSLAPPPGNQTPRPGVASTADKTKSKAEDFLAFATPAGSGKAPTGSSQSGSKAGAKSFLPFAEKGTTREEEDIFPTPNCRFISDGTEQHNQSQRVCVDELVWECEDRASADPKMAWRRYGLTRSGCGSIRRIEAVERDRQQLKRATKGWGIHD